MIPEDILNMIQRKGETAVVNGKQYNAERLQKFLETRYTAYQGKNEVLRKIIKDGHLIDDIEDPQKLTPEQQDALTAEQQDILRSKGLDRYIDNTQKVLKIYTTKKHKKLLQILQKIKGEN